MNPLTVGWLQESTVLGVRAPRFAWIASAIIILATCLQLLWLVIVVQWRLHYIRRAAGSISQIAKGARRLPGAGLDEATFDALKRELSRRVGMAPAWARFESECLRVPGTLGETGYGYWRTRPASDAFSEEAMIDDRINRSWYGAFPSLITGFGLSITFLSILIALKDLHVQADHTVTGIERLVGGLSGKFVSSIVALFSATVYSIVEKPVLRRLLSNQRRICTALDLAVPRRDVAEILSRVEDLIASQTLGFTNFGTKLAVMLKNSFNESMTESLAPQQERLIGAVQDLNAVLRLSEDRKRESVTGDVSRLLERLEKSLSSSIGTMGSTFAASLTSSASTQMGSTISSLGDTAALLGKMNQQFDATQATVGRLVAHAEASTREQLSLGKSQIQDLTTTLNNLMAQLAERTGSSVTQMSATLTAVVHDLSEKVTSLGLELSNQLATRSGDATTAAQEVIKTASHWTATSEAQLKALLDRMDLSSAASERFASILNNTLGAYRDAIAAQATTTAQVREVSNQLSAAATSINGGLQRLQAQYGLSLQAAELSKEQVERLAGANRSQVETWNSMARNMETYANIFRSVEASASSLLSAIGGRLQEVTDITHTHFESLERHTDDYLADAVKRLGGSVGDLKDTLEDLDEALARLRPETPVRLTTT